MREKNLRVELELGLIGFFLCLTLRLMWLTASAADGEPWKRLWEELLQSWTYCCSAEDSWVRTEGSWAPERSQDLGFQQILDWVVPNSLLDVPVVLSFYWLHHFFLHIVWKFLTDTSFRLTPTVLLFFISCFLSTSLLCVCLNYFYK